MNDKAKVIAAVSAVVLDDKNRVLLQKRSDVGVWGLPSGHIESGESVTQALIREMYEEAGVTVKIKKLIGIYSEPEYQMFTYPDGRREHFITMCFLCSITEGQVCCNSEETLEFRFFDKNHLPKATLSMCEGFWNQIFNTDNMPYIY